MSFFEKKYRLRGWYDNVYVLTAEEIYEQVLADSQSDYNWIAPARNLVRVCQKPNFPTEYAIAIKIAILKCFTTFERRANTGGDRYCEEPEDKKAIEYCYNSLYDADTEEAIAARKNYLSEMLTTASYVRVFDLHPVPTFRNLRNNWIKSKFDELISEKKINFEQLLVALRIDFAETVKAAEANGDFEEDDKVHMESMKLLAQKIIGIGI